MMRGGVWLKEQAEGLLDFFFPRLCPICLTSPVAIPGFCASCHADILPLPRGRCDRCALPFAARDSSPHLCEDCSRQAPPFQRVYAAGLYQGALRDAVQRFKYSARVDLDRPLSAMLQAALGQGWGGADLILPVPLHPQKLRQRGYNQALLLARLLARNLQISLGRAMLVRTTAGHSQQGLSARERAGNLRGAFSCAEDLTGKRLLLVDDVMTTGATLACCSQVLLDAGASRVEALVVARAPRY